MPWRDRLIDFRGTQIPISRIIDVVEEDCECKIIEVKGLRVAICGANIVYPPRGFLPAVTRGDVIAVCDKNGNVLKLKGEIRGFHMKDLWCYVW